MSATSINTSQQPTHQPIKSDRVRQNTMNHRNNQDELGPNKAVAVVDNHAMPIVDFASARRTVATFAAITLALSSSALTAEPPRSNDYPTVTIADYVFGCMAANGQTRRALEHCSCSIDVVASLLSHQQYIEAETILRLRLVGGEKSAVFRTGPQMKEAVARLKRAQAEADVRCFHPSS